MSDRTETIAYLILFPIPMLHALAAASGPRAGPWMMAAAVLIAVAANSAIVAHSAAKRSVQQTQPIKQELTFLRAAPAPGRIDFGLNSYFRAMVKRKGIARRETRVASEGRCPGAVHLTGSLSDLQGFRCPTDAPS